MRKRILSSVVALCMTMSMSAALSQAVSAAPAPTSANSGNCGNNLLWKLEDGVLVVSGTGAMTDYFTNPPYNSYAPWYQVRGSIEKVVISNDVTTIGSDAFKFCDKVKTVIVGNNVTSIGSTAFGKCSDLETVKLGKKVKNIDNNAFYGCRNLQSVSFGSSVKSIETAAFGGCGSLNKVFYYGTAADWQGIQIYGGNESLQNAELVYSTEISQDEITININGKKIDFAVYDNVLPFIQNERTLIPIRAIAENLGYSVDWNGELQRVTLDNGDISIQLKIDSDKAYINGKVKTLDAPACVVEERTFVPLRFVSEAVGAQVTWNGEDSSIDIVTKTE